MDFAAFPGFDAAVTSTVRSVASPALTRVMWVATVSGDAAVMTVWTVLAVVLLWAWGRRRPAVVLAALMLLDPVLAGVLKTVFARPRPPVAQMLVALPSDLGFPSGHALAALLFYGLLALFAVMGTGPAWRKALAVAGALTVAFLVGVSRVYLGVHFPSDVVAGWIAACVPVAVGWGALALWARLRGPEPQPAFSAERRARLVWLAAVCALVALAALVRQTGVDPLL